MSTKKRKLQAENKPKIIAVIGPTASGKSDLAVAIAKQYNGEVISADSRQVYTYMDIGTGKIPRDQIIARHSELVEESRSTQHQQDRHSARARTNRDDELFFHQKIRHHLLDVVHPNEDFTVADFKRLAEQAIRDIHSRGKLPILCGGTAFYVDAVLYDADLPDVPPDPTLRKKLEKRSAEDLFRELERRDPERAATIERKNKRRLVRALEIIEATGQPVPPRSFSPPARLSAIALAKEGGEAKGGGSPCNYLKIGVAVEPKKLRERIDARLIERLREGMCEEVLRLHEKENVSWERLEHFGLEYRYAALYLQQKLPADCLNEAKQLTDPPFDDPYLNALYACLSNKIWQYAKRQMTWWKRQEDITWMQNTHQAISSVRVFLT